jgi:serine/threonine protein phosphatase PrpC
MASDGLWDAVGNERALEIVMDAYARQRRSAQSVGQRSSPAGGGQRSSPAGGESATFSENGAPPPEFVAGPEFAAAITTALVAESALSPDNLSIALVAVLAPRRRRALI